MISSPLIFMIAAFVIGSAVGFSNTPDLDPVVPDPDPVVPSDPPDPCEDYSCGELFPLQPDYVCTHIPQLGPNCRICSDPVAANSMTDDNYFFPLYNTDSCAIPKTLPTGAPECCYLAAPFSVPAMHEAITKERIGVAYGPDINGLPYGVKTTTDPSVIALITDAARAVANVADSIENKPIDTSDFACLMSRAVLQNNLFYPYTKPLVAALTFANYANGTFMTYGDYWAACNWDAVDNNCFEQVTLATGIPESLDRLMDGQKRAETCGEIPGWLQAVGLAVEPGSWPGKSKLLPDPQRVAEATFNLARSEHGCTLGVGVVQRITMDGDNADERTVFCEAYVASAAYEEGKGSVETRLAQMNHSIYMTELSK